jgi:phosphoribosylaminoimidazolecarboxamide formyltransferase / IMP cyclohydrolase
VTAPARLTLKYGLNPQQGDAVAMLPDGAPWLDVLNGQVGYINLLDALKAWTLVRELATTLGLPSATSIKHVHPAGAAVARSSLDDAFRAANQLSDDALSPTAIAYIRARGGDRIASFGDFIGLSEPADESCARIIAREVSDGIIAPDYTPASLEILRKKKDGKFIILRADPDFVSSALECRRENGLELRQAPNRSAIAPALFGASVGATPIPASATSDLQLATIVAKHTPSNAVCIAYDGQAIGIGGGQQARIHATRSACEKADLWRLQLHPRSADLLPAPGIGRTGRFNLVRQWLLWDELAEEERAAVVASTRHLPPPLSAGERAAWLARSSSRIVMSSDGYIPFPDNVYRAARSGVAVIAQPGGSKQDAAVTAVADRAGIAMVHTGLRLFWH